MSNDAAMEIYKRADIIADQFLIGWHGNFAVEGMALGKPVVAYIRKPDLYLPKGVPCPIVSANPDSLKQTLVSLIENPERRRELGIQGRRYVEQVFSLERVGERMTRLYGQLGFESPIMEGVR
jgi:glycosyltransferase involved in cell wall biosynthesis